MDDKEKAELLNSQYLKVFTRENLQSVPTLDPKELQKELVIVITR